jgi:hypothetical protein
MTLDHAPYCEFTSSNGADGAVNAQSYDGSFPARASGIFGLGFSTSPDMLFWHRMTSSLGLPPVFSLTLTYDPARSQGHLDDHGELVIGFVFIAHGLN